MLIKSEILHAKLETNAKFKNSNIQNVLEFEVGALIVFRASCLERKIYIIAKAI